MHCIDVIKLTSFAILAGASSFLTACTESKTNPVPSLEAQADSPYFLLASGCELPALSPNMEELQLAVKTRLAQGFTQVELNQTVIENGAVMSFQCGAQGSIRVDALKLYLVDHNLELVEGETCSGGTVYSGWVSSLDPNLKHGDFPKIECAALKQVMTGEYAVRVCANGSEIKSLDIVAREPVTPPTGLTAFEPEVTCPAE